MADLRPFRAVTYSLSTGRDVTPLTAPPYDVIGPDLRSALLTRDARNIVGIDLPEDAEDEGKPGDRYEHAARRWREWLETGLLAEDVSPAVYVLEQRWEQAGRSLRRRAFVAAVKVEPYCAGVILPHERTLPRHVDDRLRLTRTTRANLSQILGLYSDPERAADPLFDAAGARKPLERAVDTEGVESTVWALRDREEIALAVQALAGKSVFIADGHHRYATSLAYRDERRAEAGAALQPRETEAPYEYVMMALVNMDDPDLVVLPTHRAAKAESGLDANAFWLELGRRFELTPISEEEALARLAESADTPSYVVKAGGSVRLARLKPGLDPARIVPGPRSVEWKSLDVTVLQELVLGPLLGVRPGETLERFAYPKDPREALAMVPEWDAAFLMNAARIEQLRAVALAGETMPQKSTYFYPKLLTGLLMRRLDVDRVDD